MLLIFNHYYTNNTIFLIRAGITSPASVHFASEIEKEDYENSKNILVQNKIISEIGNEARSIYFRDPVGNLVITKGNWPLED
jgi:hypothetical protein